MAGIATRVPRRQRGAVLAVSLVLLTSITILSVTAIQFTGTREKIAFNLQDRQKALHAADSATHYAWSELNAGTYEVGDFIANAGQTDFAPLYDLRNSDTVSGNKLMADWRANLSNTDWPWTDATERGEIPSNESIVDGDPMGLATAPQFAIGMHTPVLRRGSEGRKCIPYSIVGAGKGGTAASASLILVSVIPKSSCYLDLVR